MDPETLDHSTETIMGKLIEICQTCSASLSTEHQAYVAFAAGRLKELNSQVHALENAIGGSWQ